ncbi:MAG: hypothetical protein ACRDH0_13830 [Actinomycetota bacterium]
MSDLPEPPPPPPPPPAPESPGFQTGRFLLGLVIVAAGVAALLQALDVTPVPWKSVLPGALIAVGLGLVVAGTRSEQGQGGLIAVGIVLTVVLAAATAVDIPFEGGVGERVERPATLAELEDEYRLAVGELMVDLTRLDLRHMTLVAGVPQNIQARVGIGQLVVIVPGDELLRVEGRAGVGEVSIFEESDGGLGVHREYVSADGSVALSLELSVGIGEVVVQSD